MYKVESTFEVGKLVKLERQKKKITQAKVAGIAGVGVRFLSELENAKPTLEIEKVLKLVQLVGFDIYLVKKGSIITEKEA